MNNRIVQSPVASLALVQCVEGLHAQLQQLRTAVEQLEKSGHTKSEVDRLRGDASQLIAASSAVATSIPAGGAR